MSRRQGESKESGKSIGGRPTIRLTLAERILVVRRRLGMSQREMASLLGVSEFTICRNEKGKPTGQGAWSHVRRRWPLIEARYKLMIEEANSR